MNIGIWRIDLIDDGTLDTVLVATMRIQPRIQYENRYGDTSEYRDSDGILTSEGFCELCRDTAEYADTMRDMGF